MIFKIDNIPIYFPYDKIYPEQLKYIQSLLKTLQSGGHCLLEMPSGTGKTISLLSTTVSYVLHCRSVGKTFKIVYCSRTIPEIEKALNELKVLVKYIKKYVNFEFTGLGLSKRSNMCVNESVLHGFDVDAACKRLINKLDGKSCDFYESADFSIPSGVYNFDDLKEYGKANNVCPYFLVRNVISTVDCIIYPYNYLVYPSIYSIVSKNLSRDSFIIFDEAHNIDSHCIESLSVDITRPVLESSSRMLKLIDEKLKNKRKEYSRELEREYNIMNKKLDFYTEETIPYFYADSERKYEFTPGNLRNANHFLSVLKRLVEFFKTKLKTTHLTSESLSSFVNSMIELTFINKNTLKFCSQRLGIMLQTLSIEEEEMSKLKRVVEFATLVGIYSKGFSVVFEPYDSLTNVFNPVLKLCCLDSSIAISHIFENFRNVIITSGTLSPIDMYPKILNFTPSNIFEISTTLDRNPISPIIISKGNDQMILKGKEATDFFFDDIFDKKKDDDKDKLTTSFSLRSEPSVVRNYGTLILNLSSIVPDNIVVFFPSYIYMEEMVTLWSEANIIKNILKNKLVFVETPNYKETQLALENFKKASENGRGAVFFCVARGKVSEGVDFNDGLGRAVVMLGIPYMYTKSIVLGERLRYLKLEYGIKESDFLNFDALRHAAQCLGRVLRHKNDYGLMILADQRYALQGKLKKLPLWIQNRVEDGNVGISIDMAMHVARSFYKEMAQGGNFVSSSMLSIDDVEKRLKKDESG